MRMELCQHFLHRHRRDLFTALDGVIPVHQHLGLHDGHQPGLLRQGGKARQGMHIGLQAKDGRNARSNSNDRPPFGEARPQGTVFGQTPTQAVEPLSDGLTRKARGLYSALVDLDTRHDAPLCQQGGEGRAVLRLLTHGFVIENDAADERLDACRREQELAIGATVLLCGRDIDAIETSFDRPRTFIGRQDAFAFSN